MAFLDEALLNRHEPLRDQVYLLVRKAIVMGHLAPGAPVSEVEIANRLGISRTPVREAVKKVSDEGLIQIFAQQGTFVTAIDRAAVREAYVIRTALELESVKHAAGIITTRQLQDLEDIIAAHELALARARYDDAIARDDDFHRAIAEVNGFSMLWRVVDISKAQMDRCRLMALPDSGAGAQTLHQHKAIHAALAQGDPEGAGAAMRSHLATSLENTMRCLARLEAVRA